MCCNGVENFNDNKVPYKGGIEAEEEKNERTLTPKKLSRELIHRHDDAVPRNSSSIDALTLARVCHAITERNKLYCVHVYYPQTHYSHVHSVDCTLSHATNVQRHRRLGTNRARIAFALFGVGQRKSWHVLMNVASTRIVFRESLQLACLRVRDHAKARHRRFESKLGAYQIVLLTS